MNFQKIEIIGFKSFADKVEIIFDNGVTGIVGPNGCGKSNIADAIRWVLGEQSAKSLRGSSMSDVIFSGTQNRKMLSYCEVSLYFDNSNKIFPSCEYTQVILTRKLFRSGASEYYINNQPARMRDIINLLHECGVSKNGYSIIGQGKVSEILSSKPEDRRLIFEEAVGIAKTKSEKLENERKLERTRDNITRIVDLTTELERQLEPSRRAAEKTRKSIELYEDLKYNEINNYLYKYDNASTVKEKINLRLQGLIEEYAIRERESKEANDSYNLHMAQVNEFDAKINELNEQILAETVKQERTEGNTKLLREKISFCKSDTVRLEQDNAEKAEKLELLNKAIESKREMAKSFDDEIKSLSKTVDELNKELGKVLKEIQSGEDLAQSAQSKILKSADALADINRNIGSLDTEKNVISSQQKEVLDKVNALTATYDKLTQEIARLKAEILTNESLQEKKVQEIGDIEKAISEANNSVSEISNKIYKLNIEINSLETNHRIYSNIKESFDGYPQGVKNLMLSAKQNSVLNSKIKGVVASIIKTDSKYEIAIETAIGGAVQNVVTATPEDAQYLVEYLKLSKLGRATFLPVNSVKPRTDTREFLSALSEKGAICSATKAVKYDSYYESVIQYLLGNTLIVDNIQNAVQIAKKYRFSFKIVTLDGDILTASGSVSGGSKKLNQSTLLATDNKLSQIDDDLKQKRELLQKLTAQKDGLVQKGNRLVDQLDENNKQVQELKLTLTSLKEKLTSYTELSENCLQDIQANNDAIEQIAARLNDISQEYLDIELGNKKLQQEKESASDDAQKQQAAYDVLRKRRDELIENNTIKQARLSYLHSEIKSANDDIERMKGEYNDTEEIIKKNLVGISQNEQTVANLYDQIENITRVYEENSGIKTLRDELISYKEKKSKLSDQISQDDLRRQVLASEITKLSEKRHAEELAISKVDTELEYMQQRVEEEYHLTYETCQHLRDPEYNFATSQQVINDLKRKLNSLGPVNPSAIEEYETTKTRYDELMVQRTDLEKAEDDIKKAIQKLTNEMLAIFNDGFEQIRSHFQLIFKQLFGGGRADLLLDYTNVEDPLDAGVEIVAEPPGKKLQKISLLSGGEMSLTAIAILFAILKLRPMPFVVLDEIEAALDDANVERFARYLQNFSKETQFIVITHKKVTMELSDALFGVTMQEKGVSKIVSVKLSDIEDVVDAD